MSRLLSRSRLQSLPPQPPGRAPGWVGVSRGAALGIGLLCLMNLAEQFAAGSRSREVWLYSSDMLPDEISRGLLALCVPSMFLFCIRPALPAFLKLTCLLTLALPGFFCVQEVMAARQMVVDETVHYALLSRPIGVLMSLSVAAVGVFLGNTGLARGRSSLLTIVFIAAFTICTFPLLEIQTTGLSLLAGEEERADIVIVPTGGGESGPRADLVEDRIRTASEIVQRTDGGRLLLLLSAEMGMQPDAESLRSLALDSGLADQQVSMIEVESEMGRWLKPATTAAAPGERCLIVAHWYQLARLKRLVQRGPVEIQLRPAIQRHAISGQNLIVLRESRLLLGELAAPLLSFLSTMRLPSETDLPDPFGEPEAGAADADLDSLFETISEEQTAADRGKSDKPSALNRSELQPGIPLVE